MAKTPNLKELRAAIPPHCFIPSYSMSLFYLARDIVSLVVSLLIAVFLIPRISSPLFSVLAWISYGWIQGLLFTGLWVLGHECGHGAFSKSRSLNNHVGFVIHSALLTPYFSWRSTHRRHHRYTGHMEKDNSHVPQRHNDVVHSPKHQWFEKLEDSPFYVLTHLLLQQFLGWPLYVFTSATKGKQGTARKPKNQFGESNHCNPYAILFNDSEFWYIVISDIGILATLLCLYFVGKTIGWGLLCLLYGQPFLWLNNYIVAVTYLQHTHPEVPRYESDSWTFIRGALSTVDRDSGPLGRFFLHNVVDYHVVHHLFPSIPFYHAAEATEAIKAKIDQDYYIADRQSLLLTLWRTFNECRWVIPDASRSSRGVADQLLRFSR